MMNAVADRLERHQVVLYLVAIVVGLLVGLSAPGAGPGLARGIDPVLGALLYVTFLQVPASALLRAVRDVRFLGSVVLVNFVAVPVVVAVLFLFAPADQAVQIGILLVLLCPCVDYVIVFSGLAGGDSRRLLAATPVLLLLQFLTLPVFLFVFLGSDLVDVVDVQPFISAFVKLIVIPLALAWLTQWWSSRHRSGEQFSGVVSAAMVPLMMAVLGLVVASQVPAIDDGFGSVFRVVPIYVVFLVVMPIVGLLVGRLFALDVPARRSVVFSGATRNSLVVLPLALALPAGFELAAAVVVTQTLVEVIGMVIYVRVVPMLVPAR